MIKDVAVHLDGSEADAPRIAQAAAVCARFEAHLTGLYLNPLPTLTMIGDGSADVAGLAWELRQQAIAAGDATERGLAERLAAAVPLSEVRRRDLALDAFADAVAALGRTCDLTVTARPYGDAAAGIAPEVVEAALFRSGRGTLIVPPDGAAPDRFKTVLVGWRDGREAARAVAEAMPFLRAADQVVLAMIAEDGAPAEEGEEPAANIARHLDRHGVTVEARYLPRWDVPAEGLIDQARLIGADLVVAGAYGHSRMREWVMGGTTRDLLGTCPLPLLMAH